MNRQIDANILGYIVRIKDNASGISNNSTAQDIYERATTIMRRSRPFGTSIPPIYNVCVKCIKAFAVPMINDIYVSNLLADVDVMSVEPDIEMVAYGQSIPWGVSRIGGTVVNSASSIDGMGQNESMHIFILDTGVAAHPDIRLGYARSFVPYEANIDDFNGHGTAVAGVVAGRDNTEGIVGVCPGAKIHSYKCLDKNGRGQMSWALSAIEAVYIWKMEDLGIGRLGVVNISFGAYVGVYDYTALDYAISKLIDLGGLHVIVAAGNSGDIAGLYTPAHCSKAITVGAYEFGNILTEWSNYGSSVDILAPGANILTTSVNLNTRKSIYATVGGTSFAAAYVTGATALYMSMNPLKTPAEISTALNEIEPTANILVDVTRPDTTRVSIYIPTLVPANPPTPTVPIIQ
jgi:subtilisin